MSATHVVIAAVLAGCTLWATLWAIHNKKPEDRAGAAVMLAVTVILLMTL